MMNQITFLYVLSTIFLNLAIFNNIDAQVNRKKEIYNQAILDLSQNKLKEAAYGFKHLYEADSSNMNLAYLLGQSYTRLDTNLPYAIYLLEKASNKYSPDYKVRDFNERRVSEYVYFYLLMAYSLNGNCDKTISTLNHFYSIYSFANEYYLVEGQRFHRECTKRNREQKPKEKPEFKDEKVQHWVSTKPISYTNKQPLYGVQIGATLEPKYTWEFRNVKNVEVYVDENGVYRYIIGKFLSPVMAKKLLQVVKENGYPDAYIVNVKDKTRFSEKVVNMDNKPISHQLVGEVVFRVQVGAFKSDTIPDDLAYLFLELDSISEINDGQWTYLTVGKFNSLSKARFYQELVRDIGVEDAFVAAFNYNQKVDIRQAETYLNEQKALREENETKRRHK